jgi:superfamily I DNA/RNA helicase
MFEPINNNQNTNMNMSLGDDTNNKLTGLGTRSLFVVGDDAQSIYGFRGSKIEIILNFEDEYPGTIEICLNQNYRSNQQILDLAENVLTHNPGQKKKDLFTTSLDDTMVQYYMARNERDEAEFVLRKIDELYVKPQTHSSTPDTVIDTTEDQDDEKFKLKQYFNLDKLNTLK